MSALVRLLQRHDVPLVENDVYTELQFDFRHNRAAKGVRQARQDLIETGRVQLSAVNPNDFTIGPHFA